MSLVTLKPILEAAEAGGYAVPAFNTSEPLFTQAILDAAVRLNSPVILATSEKAIAFVTLPVIVSSVKALAEPLNIPVVFHLDHGKKPEIVKQCIESGYTSVMFDGSMLPFEENLALTKELAELAHAKGLSIEAEVGRVGGAEDYVELHDVLLADPAEALRFAEETKVDALAVAFGNAHGLPQAREQLHFDILETVHKQTGLPLVFHGASSTPEADIKRAIQVGVRKINIDTDLRVAATEAIRSYLNSHPDSYDPRDYLECARAAVQKVCEQKIQLFGAENQAIDRT